MAELRPGNRIYHFCGLETGLEYILPNMRLLLNPIVHTNDPRENKSFVFGARYWNSDELEGHSVEKHNERISDILREDCKALCFSKDYKNYFGYESSRMWAYYGGNHKGFCLELDKTEFLKENETLIDPNLFRDIKYFELDLTKEIECKMIDHTRRKLLGERKYLKEEFRPAHLDYLFFTKNEEWKSEQELRLVYFSENREKEYCSIQRSLKNIYVGVDFHESYLSSLAKLCPEVDLYKLEYKGVRLLPEPIPVT